jgi:hypothetical protein
MRRVKKDLSNQWDQYIINNTFESGEIYERIECRGAYSPEQTPV